MNGKYKDLGLRILMTTNNIAEAELIKGKLESAGIPVMLKGESIGGAYVITVDGWGEIKILVRKEDAEKAEEYLKKEEKNEQE